MLEGVIDRVSGGSPEAKQAIVKRYEDLIALGRIGRPEEAAVTGHSMIVDGGWTAAATR
jgi:hypothetical protein